MSLILINIAVFLMDHVFNFPIMRSFYLNHGNPQWWQFLTCTFCHANWAHLSSNLFQLLVFGRFVEDQEGAFGVWATYIITGLGGSIFSYLLLPAYSGGGLLGAGKAVTCTLGASGAIFGLFVVSVLVRLTSLNIQKLVESAILGQFVVTQILNETKLQVAGAAAVTSVSHAAHLGGALVGVVMIMLLSRIKEP